jgi:hypothetical protein
MTHPIRLMLALIAGAITTVPAFAVSAQEQITLRNATSVARIASQRAVLSTQAAATTTTSPGSPQANPNRAYPPSCAAYPLPTAPSGPTYSANVQLPQYDPAYGSVENTETVTVTVWRIACSSSGSVTPYNPAGTGYNAMTLMRIQRSAANEGQTSSYPIFPQGIAVTPATASSVPASCTSSNNCYYVRTATEPNTFLEDAANSATGIVNSTTYVLENYQGYANFPYNGAFKLWIDSGLENYGLNGLTAISVPAYAPTADTYPAAFNPVPIDGYAATNWYDPAHSGEGMMISVVDMGDNATRTFFAAWYTYNSLGLPFWITAQGTMPIGATSTGNIAGYYFTNGGFAGAFGSTATAQQWGTLSFQFQDCNHMQFTYSGQANAATNGPSGNGTRTWIRLASNNGMSCE